VVKQFAEQPSDRQDTRLAGGSQPAFDAMELLKSAAEPQVHRMSDVTFSRIDKDNDGFLTKNELATAKVDRSFSAPDAKEIDQLYRRVDRVQNLVDDEWGFENDGISRGDLKEFEDRRQTEMVAHSRAREWAKNNFDRFDQNGDGYLRLGEIDDGLESKNISSFDRNMLKYLSDNIFTVKDDHNDHEWLAAVAITRGDVRAQQEQCE